jgi:hypothetical protein
MPRVRLIHWKKAEAAEHFKVLEDAGYAIEYDEQLRPGLMKEWRENPPDAFAIDLSRLPSHGKEIAIALRQYKQTRTVPLVFCGGDAGKVSAIRELLPDAAYCEVKGLTRAIQRSLKKPVKDPVRPTAMMDRYAARSTAEKLGVKEASVVALLNPPRDVEAILAPLPKHRELREVDSGDPDAAVHLCFVKDPADLPLALSELRSVAARSKVWIAWRKGGKREAGDVTEDLVRNQALDLGLVDYKICSINAVWSAIAFALKRPR